MSSFFGDDDDALGFGIFALSVISIQAALSLGLVLGALLFVLSYRRHDDDDGALPPISVIMPCYLPNEKDIIVENVKLLCASPQFTKVVLVYNTPPGDKFAGDEERLRAFERTQPKLQLLKVPGSRSKAENLNAAIGEIAELHTLLLDADHRICELSILELRRQV